MKEGIVKGKRAEEISRGEEKSFSLKKNSEGRRVLSLEKERVEVFGSSKKSQDDSLRRKRKKSSI